MASSTFFSSEPLSDSAGGGGGCLTSKILESVEDSWAGAGGTGVEELAGANGIVVEELAGAIGTDSDVPGAVGGVFRLVCGTGAGPKLSGVLGL